MMKFDRLKSKRRRSNKNTWKLKPEGTQSVNTSRPVTEAKPERRHSWMRSESTMSIKKNSTTSSSKKLQMPPRGTGNTIYQRIENQEAAKTWDEISTGIDLIPTHQTIPAAQARAADQATQKMKHLLKRMSLEGRAEDAISTKAN